MTNFPQTPPTVGNIIIGYNAAASATNGCCFDLGDPEDASDNCTASPCKYRLNITATTAGGGSGVWHVSPYGNPRISQTGSTFTYGDPSDVSLTCGKTNSYDLYLAGVKVATIAIKCSNCTGL